MRIHIKSGSQRKEPNQGDIKTNSKGQFIRRQVIVNGMHVVSRGKPVYDWIWFAEKPEGHKGRQLIDYCGLTSESMEILRKLRIGR